MMFLYLDGSVNATESNTTDDATKDVAKDATPGENVDPAKLEKNKKDLNSSQTTTPTENGKLKLPHSQ